MHSTSRMRAFIVEPAVSSIDSTSSNAMLILLSPAKTLDFDTPPSTDQATEPEFLSDAKTLITELRKHDASDIAALMKLSPALAQLNVDRYKAWSSKQTQARAKQAMLAFDGDVYDGLNARTLSASRLAWAQDHVRILSGLYGVLKPLDSIRPYRLEMGTRLANKRGKDLYSFWGDRPARALHAALAHSKGKTRAIVNCASDEYFKVVDEKRLDVPVIHPVFEDWNGGRWKIVSFYAKRARGAMARYAIDHRANEPEKLKGFDSAGYVFAPDASDERRWVFRRKEVPA